MALCNASEGESLTHSNYVSKLPFPVCAYPACTGVAAFRGRVLILLASCLHEIPNSGFSVQDDHAVVHTIANGSQGFRVL